MIRSYIQTFSWAAYLVVSWMWCIGLFYPLMLNRDYGPTSWYLFAIPNIVGASLFPFFIRNSLESEKFILTHALAIKLFSIVTIIFQCFFIAWFLDRIDSLLLTICIALISLIIISCIYRSRYLGLTLTIFLASIVILGVYHRSYSYQTVLALSSDDNGRYSLGLIPVFLTGFLLCPYFDLTFHRVVRLASAERVKFIFVVAFILFFSLFLAAGIAYYPIVSEIMFSDQTSKLNMLIVCMCCYLLIQAIVTGALHLFELSTQIMSRYLWVILVAGAFLIVLLGVYLDGDIELFGNSMTLRECVYRTILAFYGLMAPAYLWIFVVVKKILRNYSMSNVKEWAVWCITVCVAAPFYTLGFFGKVEWTIIVIPIGTLVILLISIIAYCFLASKTERFVAYDKLH